MDEKTLRPRGERDRVRSLFARLKRERRCGLIAYVTCGDGDTVGIVRELERAGADAIELGIPFSDPIADGPVIQAAAQRALERGTTPAHVLAAAREIRSASGIPLIAFSYLNPVLRYGVDAFAHDAAEAGIDAMLLTDLPPESAREVRGAAAQAGLGLIFLAAPTTPARRLRAIDRASDGFVYYVSTTGVTGARRDLDPDLLERLEAVRTSCRKPLAVGFGVSTNAHYLALAGRCEAVVVGSAIVRAVAGREDGEAAAFAGQVVREILGTADF